MEAPVRVLSEHVAAAVDRRPYQSYYDPDTILKVAEDYSADVDQFGYFFEGVTEGTEIASYPQHPRKPNDEAENAISEGVLVNTYPQDRSTPEAILARLRPLSGSVRYLTG